MLSLTCKTAIKAVIYLASKYESGEKCSILSIAEYIEASEHTVGKFLQKLVKYKVIQSTKGPAGGFHLSPEQMLQPVIRVVEAIDTRAVFSQCGLGLSKCSSTHPCPIHDDYLAIRDGFQKLCEEKSVIDLCDPVNSGLAYLYG